ncbi:sulfotransferase 2B1-like [Lissotriton helveticus]
MSVEYFEYKGILIPSVAFSEASVRFAENHFPVLDDDVFNVTYPKSGTVWMLEILSLIRNYGDPTWNREVPNWKRVPWYESIGFREKAENYSPPRMFTSHLPRQLFAKSFFSTKAKVIYTIRNPKDVLVSMYHYASIANYLNTPSNFEELLGDFLAGRVPFGSWFDHVQGWMEMKDRSKFFFITYDELLEDLHGSVVRICEFLGKKLDEDAIDRVVKNSSFEAMKNNDMCNYSKVSEKVMDMTKGQFLRKGTSGDWKNHFTVAQSERFDRVYKERMKGIKITWDEIDSKC